MPWLGFSSIFKSFFLNKTHIIIIKKGVRAMSKENKFYLIIAYIFFMCAFLITCIFCKYIFNGFILITLGIITIILACFSFIFLIEIITDLRFL